jgi:integrase
MARRNQGPKLRWVPERETYYITWTINGRSRKRSTGTADREAAEKILGEWIRIRGRKSGPSDPAEILVTDVLNDYATEKGPKVAAPRIIGCAIEAMSPYWQGLTVASVTEHTCNGYRDWRARSNNTVRRELAVLQAAINWGFKHNRLTRSMAVTLPAKPLSKTRWLTKVEAARLLKAARTKKARLYMPLFILIGLYTGRRKEAILSLRWPQVDLDAGVIDFGKPGEPETNKRRGKVRLSRKLVAHLRRARRRGTDLGYVVHDGGNRIGDIKKGFAAACQRAGLVKWEKVREALVDGAPCTWVRAVPTLTPHTLRHTAATWLMQAGVRTWEAAGFLAMSEKILIDVYGHHHPDYQRVAAEALSKRVSRMGA